MASGKSLVLRGFDNMMAWRRPKPWEQKERDRSLNGKARIKARKAANKTR
jgi:hypothetical protein